MRLGNAAKEGILSNGKEKRMVPPPVALGLTLCDYVIVEEGTAKVSLIGTLTKLGVESFPSEPRTLYVFAALTDGAGDATINLVITQLDTDEEIYAEQLQVNFPDKLTEVQLVVEVPGWSFPGPGWYEFALLVEGALITHRPIEVYLEEESA